MESSVQVHASIVIRDVSLWISKHWRHSDSAVFQQMFFSTKTRRVTLLIVFLKFPFRKAHARYDHFAHWASIGEVVSSYFVANLWFEQQRMRDQAPEAFFAYFIKNKHSLEVALTISNALQDLNWRQTYHLHVGLLSLSLSLSPLSLSLWRQIHIEDGYCNTNIQGNQSRDQQLKQSQSLHITRYTSVTVAWTTWNLFDECTRRLKIKHDKFGIAILCTIRHSDIIYLYSR